MSAISRRCLIAGAISIATSAAAFAAGQDGQDQQGGGQSGPQITVQQPEPKIQVQQPQPKVTVQQPQPNVTVQQPPPQVQVTQPKPQVSVQQGKPQVEVLDQGKQPQVTVEQGQPHVNVQQGQPGQMQAQQGQPGALGGSPLLTLQAGAIKDMKVKNREGQTLGEVDRVAIDPNTHRAFAIVSVGGFLGIGEKLVPMDLSQMQMTDKDTLVAPVSMTEDQLKNSQAYNKSDYRELDNNETLAEAIGPGAGMEGGTGLATSDFARLDRNHDGVIEPDEAQQDPSLSARWQSADTNGDGKIDQSEFSAFERSGGIQGQGQGQGLNR